MLVDWNEARAYCKARGGDLLTGDQWSKAAGGPTGKEFGPASDKLKPGEANYDWGADAPHGPTDVMTYKPNGWGIYDMKGNVWEWVLDGLNDDAFKDYRGGSWFDVGAAFLQASLRCYDPSAPTLLLRSPSSFRLAYLGFRCGSAPSPAEATAGKS